MNSRDQQAKETRKKILEVSRSLFQEYGFENVSIDKICKHTHISKGGFYHHFESKDTLIAILIGDDLDEELGRQITPLLGKLPVRELLKKYTDILVDYHEDRQPDIIAKYWYSLAEIDDIDTHIRNRYALSIMDTIAAQGLEQKDFHAGYSVSFCSRFLTASITGLFIHWNGCQNTYDLREFVQQSLELILRALQK